MAFPVTINGRTYTLADFSGQNYVTGFPDALQDFVTEAGQTVTDAEAAQTAAETAQTGAEAAQTAAEAAQAAAEAAQEAIDGLYLGAQASNPAVDLNGDPLTAGDWYFNTTDNNSRVYDGSAWNIIDPDLSGDASPTLGGDLDGSGYNISGVGDLTISGDLTVDTNTLYVDSTNNRVGIGVTNPNHKLTLPQVDGTSIGMDASTGFTLNGTSCTYYGLTYQNRTGTGFNTILSGYDNILFATLGAERVRITSGGNVGIGTTDPQAPLQIAQGATGTSDLLQLDSDGTRGLGISLNTSSTGRNRNRTVYRSGDLAGEHEFLTGSGTSTLYLKADGNVGIGKSPARTLDIEATAGSIGLSSTSGGAEIRFNSANTNNTRLRWNGNSGYFAIRDDDNSSDRFIVDGSGNVGIGVSDPQGFRIATRYNDNMMRLRGSDLEYLDFTASTASDQLQINAVNGDLSLAVNGSQKVRIESNGNVRAYNNLLTKSLTIGNVLKKNIVASSSGVSTTAGATQYIKIGTIRCGISAVEIVNFGNSGYNGARLEFAMDFNNAVGNDHPSVHLKRMVLSDAFSELEEVYAEHDSNDSANIWIKVVTPSAAGQTYYFSIENLGVDADDVDIDGTIQTTDPGLTPLIPDIYQGGSGNRIGFGNKSPSSIAGGTDSNPILSIGGSDSTLNAVGDRAGTLSFITSDLSYTNTFSDGVAGEIASQADTSTGGGMALVMYTGNAGVDRGERLRISSAGDILINEADNSNSGAAVATSAEFAVAGSTGQTNISNTGNELYFSRVGANYISATNAGASLIYTAGSSNSGAHYWRAGSSDNAMTLRADGAFLVGTDNSSRSADDGLKVAQNSGTNLQWCLAVVGDGGSGDTGYTLYDTGAAAYRFYVTYNGNIFATSTSITAISDATLKENVRDLDKGLDTILALQPRRFDWINGDGDDIMGFIAQEVEEVMPELVHDYEYSEGVTKKGLKMGDMVPSLVKAIQEQQAMIETLQAQVAELQGVN